MRAPAILLSSLLLLPLAARGQSAADDSPMAARLSAEKTSDVEPGLYSAGDSNFTLTPAGTPEADKVLLHFVDAQEVFALTVDRASLGSKLLKYDTGATALRISIWGGLTFYGQGDPNGLPVTRQGDLPAAAESEVSAAALTQALNDEAAHLSYVQKIGLRFSADPGVLGGDDTARAGAFAALTNTGRGIERFLNLPGGHKALLGRLESVRISAGTKPGVQLVGRNLMVSFVAPQGVAGSASSHAVEHALGKLLAVATVE